MIQKTLPIFGDSIENGGPLPVGIEQGKASLANGAPLDVALKSGGFTLQEYESWKNDEDKEELIKELNKAEADFCVRCLRQVAVSADMGDVKSAQWLLERRFSAHFGRATAKSVKVSDEHQVAIVEEIGGEVMHDMSEEDYRAVAVEILKRKINVTEVDDGKET